MIPIIKITEENKDNERKQYHSYASRVGSKVVSSNEPKNEIRQVTRQDKRANLTTQQQQRNITRNSQENKQNGINPLNNTAITNNDGFKVTTYKRRRQMKYLGTAEVNEENKTNGFTGEEKKIWLYIYRVKRTTEEQHIFNYITDKEVFQKNSITVKELPSEESQLTRFVVTAPFDKIYEMYDTNFWPGNVGVKRFILSKHREFLNQQGSGFLDEIRK